MPELAEVETVRKVLETELIGLKIKKIDLLYEPIFENKEYLNNLLDNEITSILRKGKYLIFCFKNGYMLSHLRMEGKYFYVEENYPLNKHMHVIFYLSNNQKLIYQDVRKFGRMHYYDTLEALEKDLKIGVDANLALPYLDELYLKLKNVSKPIKSLLLDQSFVAGIGNIYADEILYEAKIMPNIKSKELNKEDLKHILEASKAILDKAILYKGTTIRSYTSSLGVSGSYQNFLNVHTKEQDPNGNIVLKMKIDGRTTYYSPIRQFNNKFVVGLTGSIASGKSNVKKELVSFGFKTFDSDLVVKEAYHNEEILNKLRLAFKECQKGATIDKKLLATIIFNNQEKRQILNNIIHPYVIDKMEEFIKNNNLGWLDIPLLYECNLEKYMDAIILCYLPLDLEIERLMLRDNISKEEALLKINSQLSLEIKREKTNYIVDTSLDFKTTRKNLIKVLEELFYGFYL